MKKASYIIFCLLLILSFRQAPGQQPPGAANPSWYLFRPEVIYPSGGDPRQLTAGFELRFSVDSLFCYLPYQGRAFSAAYGSRDGGLNFTSTQFDRKEQTTPKGEQTIILKPKDQPDIREISIAFKGDGYAYVQVFFNQKQPVSYRGQIVSGK